MITFVCWKWNGNGYRERYVADHVNVWGAMIKRHYPHPHRLLCVTDDPRGVQIETYPLWNDCDQMVNPNGKHLPSCFRRLKIFSAETTSAMGIHVGAPVASIDLDVVITGDLSKIFNRPEDFVGWKGRGTYRPVVYNGSMFLFRAGKMSHLWDDFSPSNAEIPRRAGYFGSDQAWISFKLNGRAPGWTSIDGVLSYSSDVRTMRLRTAINMPTMPQRVRVVNFNGKIKPWHEKALLKDPWIRQHWRM